MNFGGAPTDTTKYQGGITNSAATGNSDNSIGFNNIPPPGFGGTTDQGSAGWQEKYGNDANNAANQYAQTALGQQNVAAPNAANGYTDAANANAISNLNSQYDALGQLQAEANGQHLPGVDAQRQQGLAAAYANQSSLARGAGAGSAGAAANRAVAFNNANATTNANNQGVIQNAQNQATAQNQYATAASNFANQTQGYLNNQQGFSSGQGALALGQQGINNGLTEGYQGLGSTTAGQQLAADTSAYNTRNNAASNQAGAQNTANYNEKTAGASAAVGTASGVFRSFTSDVRAKQDIAPAGFGATPQTTLGPRGMMPMGKVHGSGAMGAGVPMQGGVPMGAPSMPSQPARPMQSQMVMSDERTKVPSRLTADDLARESGRPAEPSASATSMHQTEADRFLATMSPYSYRYKDPTNEPTDSPHGGRYLGVMAQNLERGPTGDTIVKDTPRGKALEGGALMSAMAAGEGRLHERLSAAEAQIAAMKGGR